MWAPPVLSGGGGGPSFLAKCAVTKASPQSNDKSAAKELWKISEESTKKSCVLLSSDAKGPRSVPVNNQYAVRDQESQTEQRAFD